MAYHLERHRERFGKVSLPSEYIFGHFVNAFLRNAQEVEDLVLVPVTINYDKVYEGEAFPYELLGEEKPKESLMKLLKQIVISKERQGKIFVKYCKPISLKQLIADYSNANNIPGDMIASSVVDSQCSE